MNNRFSRLMIALALAASLWTTAVATSFGQQQQQPQQQTPQTQQQTTPATDSKKPATAEPTTPAVNHKPLSTDEDPTMIGKRNINKGLIARMSGSTEKEVKWGREQAAEIDKAVKFIDDPIITEYVNRVGQNIVLHSDAKVPFTIKVIDSDEVNAFALPGGFFYVNKGLVLAADNEAELAGVMAHEIGHVAARHASEMQTKATIAQYAILIPAIVLGGGIGQAIYQGGNFGALLGFMKFSRGAEEEADRLGVQYMWAAGYDPNAMATMFEKLEAKNKKKPGFVSKLFASHPAPPERRAAAIQLAARFPEREEYVISTSEFQRVKGRLLRLSNARASAAGTIEGGENGTPGRPTLKRRQPTPDDTTTTPEGGEQKPADKQTVPPPQMKRNDGSAPPPQSQPSPTP
ncbi:MAG TPA: M48 family metallopeptidase [Pyrinomonadaceae bacterium]|jgi:predicted Zn-dependent protease